jgi:hypothetical protein
VRGRRRRDRHRDRHREELRERGGKVVRIDRGRLRPIQRALWWRRNLWWWCRGIPCWGEKRGELGLEKRGGVDARGGTVQVGVVDVRHRVPRGTVRENDQRERDARAPRAPHGARVCAPTGDRGRRTSSIRDSTRIEKQKKRQNSRLFVSGPYSTRARRPYPSPYPPPCTPG